MWVMILAFVVLLSYCLVILSQGSGKVVLCILKFRGSKKAKLTQQPIELKRKKASAENPGNVALAK
jgi:hypothetical protein